MGCSDIVRLLMSELILCEEKKAWMGPGQRNKRSGFFAGKSLIILALGKLSGGVFVCLLMLEFVICQTSCVYVLCMLCVAAV